MGTFGRAVAVVKTIAVVAMIVKQLFLGTWLL
jgi:hypothetical protein